MFGDEQLRAIEAPRLVIVGERDRLLDSADTARRVRRLLPHAHVRMLADQPHFIRGPRDARFSRRRPARHPRRPMTS
ncbi:alpha/beta fold hydrolase [Burkholderia thailandensis]|uniref:alpha/beta fold hydrolase n=1 Tax=Burkholderia thailandensis TaxID=57975 RepID=UPI001652459B|nr:hypothetical protein [Burkholderia thailandensis]